MILVTLDAPEGQNLAAWMYARARGMIRFSDQLGLHHWVHDYVGDLTAEDVIVEVIGERCRTWFEGRWISTDVVLCDAYGLSVGDHRVEITDDALWDGERILVPSGDASGRVVRQVSSFIDDNEHFRDDDLEADRDELG